MSLLARGLVESSAQRTLSSLGDRNQYIGMSDIGRALECPRAAVGRKLFGNGDDLVHQHDLSSLLARQLVCSVAIGSRLALLRFSGSSACL
jgi:hypothetical protein